MRCWAEREVLVGGIWKVWSDRPRVRPQRGGGNLWEILAPGGQSLVCNF